MAISEIPVDKNEAQKAEKEKWYSRLYKRIKKFLLHKKLKKKINVIIQ